MNAVATFQPKALSAVSDRKPVRRGRNETGLMQRARLERWLNAQISPFARRAAKTALRIHP